MMNRERLVSFMGASGNKIADIYYDVDVKEYYVHYKTSIEDMGVIRFFDNEEDAEESARDYAFGEKYGERVV